MRGVLDCLGGESVIYCRGTFLYFIFIVHNGQAVDRDNKRSNFAKRWSHSSGEFF